MPSGYAELRAEAVELYVGPRVSIIEDIGSLADQGMLRAAAWHEYHAAPIKRQEHRRMCETMLAVNPQCNVKSRKSKFSYHNLEPFRYSEQILEE